MVGSLNRLAQFGITPPRPFLDALHDGFLIRPVEPDLVGQIGRAELAIALAFGAMTDRAIVGEYLLAER